VKGVLTYSVAESPLNRKRHNLARKGHEKTSSFSDCARRSGR
jgi:hypothetical protein